MGSYSKFLYKKFLQDPNPAAIILIENVEEKFLHYFFKMVYDGQVLVKRNDFDGFKQALRSLNVQGDEHLRKFIYEEDDDELNLSSESSRSPDEIFSLPSTSTLSRYFLNHF